MKEMELQTPDYEFVEPEQDAQPVSPIKRQIAKIQNTATTFSLYEVYQTLGQLDKLIADKEAEIAKHREHKALFEAELALIEASLGVSDLEQQFQNELAAEAAVAEALKNPQVQDNEKNS